MPHYRVCYNHNIRAHRYQNVVADNADAAIDEALKKGEWEELETASQELGDADALDPTFWVDPCDQDGKIIDDREGEEIKDEYTLPGGYPYNADLLALAQQIARLQPYGDGVGYFTPSEPRDAEQTLNGIIREARLTLGQQLSG